jgi:hypothetical protein
LRTCLAGHGAVPLLHYLLLGTERCESVRNVLTPHGIVNPA